MLDDRCVNLQGRRNAQARQIMRAVVDDGRLIQRTSAYQAVMFEIGRCACHCALRQWRRKTDSKHGYQKVLGLTLAPLVEC